MFFLLILSAVAILYGTLFPLDFGPAEADSIVAALEASLHVRPGRGDILSNVVLFLPFGFFGMQALTRIPRFVRFILVVALGTALSFGIEWAQLYLASRTTSIYDLTLNSFGTFVAAIIGWVDWRNALARLQSSAKPAALFPLFLVAAWLGYRLFPYVPTIDLQHVKDAIKPLLAPQMAPVDVFRHFVVVMVIGRLLQSLLGARLALLGVVVVTLGIIAAKPFIMTKVIAPAEVAGTIAGLAVWLVLLSRLKARTVLLAVLLSVQLVLAGVIPWELRPEPAGFSLVPFIGFEGGSMSVNLMAFLEKIFLYGTLIWLFVEAGLNLVLGTVVTAVLLTGIELAQTQLVGRVSEITDPLLAVAMGVTFFAVDRHQRASYRARPAPAQ
jgi:VanZ family protein